MAKKKMTNQQRKFKTAVNKCHAESNSSKSFGKCLSDKLKKKGGKK